MPATGLLASLIGDVTRATQESDKARDVTKAIALLLIEKGILTLEELQAQIVQQKTDESS